MFLFAKPQEFKYQFELIPDTLTFTNPAWAVTPMAVKWIRGARTSSSLLCPPSTSTSYRFPDKPCTLISTMYARGGRFASAISVIKVKTQYGRDLRTVGRIEVDLSKYCRREDVEETMERELQGCSDHGARFSFTLKVHWLKELSGNDLRDDVDGDVSVTDGSEHDGRNGVEEKDPRAQFARGSSSGYMSSTSSMASTPSAAKLPLPVPGEDAVAAQRRITTLQAELAVLHRDLHSERERNRSLSSTPILDRTAQDELARQRRDLAARQAEIDRREEAMQEEVNRLRVQLRIANEDRAREGKDVEARQAEFVSSYEKRLKAKEEELTRVQRAWQEEKDERERGERSRGEEKEVVKGDYMQMVERVRAEYEGERKKREDDYGVSAARAAEERKKEREDAEAEKARLLNDLKAAKTQADAVEEQKRATEAERAHLEREKDALLKERDALLAAEVERVRVAREEEERTKLRMQAEAARMQRELEEAKERETQREKDREAERAKNAHLSAEQQQHQAELRELEEQVAMLQETIIALKAHSEDERVHHLTELAAARATTEEQHRKAVEAQAAAEAHLHAELDAAAATTAAVVAAERDRREKEVAAAEARGKEREKAKHTEVEALERRLKEADERTKGLFDAQRAEEEERKEERLALESRLIDLQSTVRAKDKAHAELEEQLDRETRERKRLLAEKDTALEEARADILSLRTRLAELTAALEAERERVASLEAELREKQEDLEEAHATIAERSAVLERMKREKDVEDARRKDLQAKMMALEQAQIDREARIFDLEKAVLAAKDDHVRITREADDKVAQKERERLATVKEKEAADARVQGHVDAIAKLERDKAAVVVERDSILNQKLALEKERRDVEDRHSAALKATTGSLGDVVRKHEAELAAAAAALVALKAEHATTVEKERAGWAEERGRLEREKEAMVATEAERVRVQREDEERERARKAAELAQMQKEVEEAKEREAQREKEREAATANLSQEEKAHQQAIMALEHRIAALDATVVSLKAKAEDDRVKAAADADRLRKERDDAGKQLAASQSALEAAQADLKKAEAARAEKESALIAAHGAALAQKDTAHATAVAALTQEHGNRLEALEGEKDALTATIAAKTKEAASHQASAAGLSTQLKDGRAASAAELAAAAAASAAAIEAVRAEMKSREDAHERRLKEKDDALSEHVKREQDADKSRIQQRYKEQEELAALNAAHAEQLAAVQAEVDRLEKEEARLNKDLLSLKQQWNDKDKELAALLAAQSVDSKDKAAVHEQLRQAVKDKDGLTRQLDGLKADFDAEADVRKRAEAQAAVEAKKAAELQVAVEKAAVKAKVDREDADKRAKELNARILQLEQMVIAKDERIYDLERQLTAARDDKDAAVRALEAELGRTQSDRDRLKREKADVEAQVAAHLTSISRLEKEKAAVTSERDSHALQKAQLETARKQAEDQHAAALRLEKEAQADSTKKHELALAAAAAAAGATVEKLRADHAAQLDKERSTSAADTARLQKEKDAVLAAEADKARVQREANEAERARLVSELAEARRELEAAKAREAEREKEKAAQIEANAHLSQEEKAHQQHIADLDSKLRLSESALASLKAKADEERVKAAADADKLRAERDELQKSVTAKQSQLDALHADMKKADVARSEKEAAAAAAAAAALAAAVAEAQKKHATDIASLQSSHAAALSQQAKTHSDSTSTLSTQLSAQLSTAQSQADSHKAAASAEQKRREEVESKLKALQDTHAALTATLTAEQAQRAGADKGLEELRAKAKAAQAEVDALHKAAQDKEKERVQLVYAHTQALAASQKEQEALKAQIATLQADIARQQDDVAAARSKDAERKKHHEDEVKEYEGRVKRLEAELKERDGALLAKASSSKASDVQVAALKDKEKEVMELQERLAQAKAKLTLEKDKTAHLSSEHSRELSQLGAAQAQELSLKNQEIALLQQQMTTAQLKIEELTGLIIDQRQRIQDVNDALNVHRRKDLKLKDNDDAQQGADGMGRLLKDVQAYHRQVELLERQLEELQKRRDREKKEQEDQATKLIRELTTMRERRMVFDKVNKPPGKGKDAYFDKMTFYQEQLEMSDETMMTAQQAWNMSTVVLSQQMKEAEDKAAKAVKAQVEAEAEVQRMTAEVAQLKDAVKREGKEKQRVGELMSRFEVELVQKKVELANALDKVSVLTEEAKRLKAAMESERERREAMGLEVETMKEKVKGQAA